MMAPKRKRTLKEEGRAYNEEWKLKYFLVPHKDKMICLLCNTVISCLKKYNANLHYEIHKKNKYYDLEGEERKIALNKLKETREHQQQTFMKVFHNKDNANTKKVIRLKDPNDHENIMESDFKIDIKEEEVETFSGVQKDIFNNDPNMQDSNLDDDRLRTKIEIRDGISEVENDDDISDIKKEDASNWDLDEQRIARVFAYGRGGDNDTVSEYRRGQKDEERKFLLKCIKVYQSLPALWKVKSEAYMNREKKTEAYGRLLAVYREKYPDATREDLKKKLNSLRTNFRKELKKTRNPKKSLTGRDEVYESNLWYFDAMRFLMDQETPDDSSSSTIEEDGEPSAAGTPGDGQGGMKSHQHNKRRRGSRDQADDVVQPLCPRLRGPMRDEYQLAATWARELMKMEPQQQLFAKKFINDILFEGQMGTLHRNAVAMNPLSHTTPSTYESHSSDDAPSQPPSSYSAMSDFFSGLK